MATISNFIFDISQLQGESQEEIDSQINYFNAAYLEIANCSTQQNLYIKLFNFIIDWSTKFLEIAKTKATFGGHQLTQQEMISGNAYYQRGIPSRVLLDDISPNDNDSNNPKYDFKYLVINDTYNSNYIAFSLSSDYEILQQKRFLFLKIEAFNNNIYNKKRDDYLPIEFNHNITSAAIASEIASVNTKLSSLLNAIQTEKQNLTSLTSSDSQIVLSYIFDTLQFLSSDLFNDLVLEIQNKARGLMLGNDNLKQNIITNFLDTYFGELRDDEDDEWQILGVNDFFNKAISLINERYAANNVDFFKQKRKFLTILPSQAVTEGFEAFKMFLLESFGDDYISEIITLSYNNDEELNYLVKTLVTVSNDLIKNIPIKWNIHASGDDAYLNATNISLYNCWEFGDLIAEIPQVKASAFLRKIDNGNTLNTQEYWLRFKDYRTDSNHKTRDTIETYKLLFGPRPIIRILDVKTTRKIGITSDSITANCLIFLFLEPNMLYLKSPTPNLIPCQKELVWQREKRKKDVDVPKESLNTLKGFTKIEAAKGTLNMINFENLTLSFSNLFNKDNAAITTYNTLSNANFKGLYADFASEYRNFFRQIVKNIPLVTIDVTSSSVSPISLEVKNGKNYHLYYAINSTNNILQIITWESFGFGGSSAFRVDKINPKDYVWYYFGSPEYQNLPEILGLDKERSIEQLDAESYNIYSGNINVHTYFNIFNVINPPPINYHVISLTKATETYYYIQCQLPQIDTSALPANSPIVNLFRFVYYRRIFYNPASPEHLQVYKLTSGAKYKPNKEDNNFAINIGSDNESYILVNPPVNIDAHIKQNRGTRKKIKNKGSVIVGGKRSMDAGEVMKNIKNVLKAQSLQQGIGSTSISATRFSDKIVNAGGTASVDWKFLKVPKNARDNNKGVFKISQDWCHLMAAGLGGKDSMGNLVSGSAYCNSEQLAFESALMNQFKNYPNGTFMLKVTAYLIQDDSLKADTNYLDEAKSNYDYIQNAYTINQYRLVEHKMTQDAVTGNWSSNAGINQTQEFNPATLTNAPIAAFIRYKIYRLSTSGHFHTKIMDYTMEGQSEFFDINQSRIVNYSTKFLLAKDEDEFKTWYNSKKNS